MNCSTICLPTAPRHVPWCGVAGATLGLLSASLWPAGAVAQETSAIAVASRITIVPRVSVAETFTNNVRLDNANKQSELITQVGPGIRISSSGGRIRGSIDYSLTELLYANNTSGRQSQNSLAASGTIEAVDNWAFLDFSGSISQQAISAFGKPSSAGVLAGGNSTETSVYRLSPFVRGQLAGVGSYEARYSITSLSSASAAALDSEQRDASLRLSGGQSSYGLSWGFDASHQAVGYSGAGRSTSSSSVNGRLQYALNERWGAYTRVGHESNDFSALNGQQSDFVALGGTWTPNPDLRVSLDKDNRGFTGLGINWAPSKRTSVTVTRNGQLYGTTHTVVLGYRTANTAWTFSDSRGVSSSPAQGAGVQPLSLYDLLTAQFAAGETDTVKREQYDAFLLANGIRPNTSAVGGFLSSSVSLQRSQQLSFALFGARSTLSMFVTRSRNTKLDTLSTAVDDFLTSSAVTQNGLSANYSYRLTAKSVVSLAAARQATSGSNGVAGTSSKTFNVNLSTQLTRETSASVGARRVIFDSTTTPYSETAVTGNLQVLF